MTPAEIALRELIAAIDANVGRRVLLSKKPGERRAVAVIEIRSILPEYDRARAVLVHLNRTADAVERPGA